jgi:hypothetical protein
MPNRSAEIATYAGDMAKVEVNLPDDLLRRIDEAADRAGETRDEFLRRMAERGVAESRARRHRKFEEMMPEPVHGGGNWGWWIREDRRHRDDKRFGRDPRFGPDTRPPDER